MSQLRSYLSNPQWAATYKMALSNNNNGQYYGHWNYDNGAFYPLFTDANSEYAVELKRSGHASNQYTTSVVNPAYRSLNKQLNNCGALYGDPHACASAILRN